MKQLIHLWEILVPCMMRGRPVRTRHHKEWDKVIRSMAGGLTIMSPVKGQWVEPATDKLWEERIIPVRVACTQKQMQTILRFTLRHYDQQAIMAYKVSNDVIFYTKETNV